MWINLDPKELELIRHCVGSSLGDSGKADGADVLINKLEEWERDSKSPLHKHFNEVAFETFEDEGALEIDRQGDDTVMVSISEDGGAYVMAWRWVDNADADICTECGDFPGSATYGTVGDGYDGLCPSCADKAEQSEEEDEDE